MSEQLYNGIEPTGEWPPRNIDSRSFQPMRVPWLENPPEIIPIDLGRQLFVDDFLLQDCRMVRTFHPAVKYPGNPVFFPETKWECNPEFAPTAIPKCGGVCYDESDGLFKMWYMASYVQHLAYAVSRDGIHWERPLLDVVPGSNLVLPEDVRPDSGTVWLDRDCTNPEQRFKMQIREANDALRGASFGAQMRTSADGIHWSEPQLTGPMGDRSTMFYNPFRRKWVQSIRGWITPRNRCRFYYEAEDFYASGRWKEEEPVFWVGADCYDRGETVPPELYNLDATPYESLLIGFFQILKGPPNPYGEASGLPKLTELYAGYSRDGFHWHRPDREPLIGACRQDGCWEYGYVESTGGGLLTVGDELWIYYSAYAGDTRRTGSPWTANGMYSNAATGLAKLRRDGFVSLRAGYNTAQMLTRKVLFHAGHLFVNVNTAGSLLTVECQQSDGRPIPGFTAADCLGYRGNSTSAEIRWKNEVSLKSLAGHPLQFLFQMERGDLYSFWITDAADGSGTGYFGAGKK